MELLRRLRAAGSIVPVVILTAHGSIPEAVEAMKLGAIDFLTKPTTPDALRRVVAEVIDRHAVPHPTEAGDREPGPKPSDRSQQIAGIRPRAGQASHQSRPVQRGGRLAPRADRHSIRDRLDAHELLDRLQKLKEQEARGSFRILRDWFPSGNVAENGKK